MAMAVLIPTGSVYWWSAHCGGDLELKEIWSLIGKAAGLDHGVPGYAVVAAVDRCGTLEGKVDTSGVPTRTLAPVGSRVS